MWHIQARELAREVSEEPGEGLVEASDGVFDEESSEGSDQKSDEASDEEYTLSSSQLPDRLDQSGRAADEHGSNYAPGTLRGNDLQEHPQDERRVAKELQQSNRTLSSN